MFFPYSLAFQKHFSESVSIIPCEILFSGCCWRRQDPQGWNDFKTLTTLLPYDVDLFHAACCPAGRAKLDRLFHVLKQNFTCNSDMSLLMTTSEKTVIQTILSFVKHSRGTCKYLELGSGGSTAHFPNLASFTISIENHRQWFDRMESLPDIVCLKRNDLLSYNYVSSGPTRSLGKPLLGNQHDISLFGKQYIDGIINVIVEHQKIDDRKFDVVLVDGRYRVASVLHAGEWVTENGVVLIHDWQRHEYHVILEYFDLLFKADKLAVLKLKPGRETQAASAAKRFYGDWL